MLIDNEQLERVELIYFISKLNPYKNFNQTHLL